MAMGLRAKIRGLKKWQKVLLVLVLLALIALAVAFALGVFDKEQPKPAEPEKKYYSQLTGKEVAKDVSERPILGVMMENSEEARPQSGLDDAGMVFETVTEGGITRYLALFQEDMPENVGPVRSVRPPFVNWVTGLDSTVSHVGGSTEALELIDTLGAKSINEFKYPDAFYRSNDRPSPHNMYARTKDLREVQKELDYKKSKFADFPRSNDAASQTPTAQNIQIEFSSPAFSVTYRYDAQTNSYQRFLAGVQHVDAITNKQLTVKNVVVLKLKGSDSNSLQVIGSGEALVFKDGNVTKARWQQTSANERIKLLDEAGKELSLSRGETWFAGLPISGSVSY